MKSRQIADYVLGLALLSLSGWTFFEKNMKSTCINQRLVYIKCWNRFLLRSFLFHALLNVNTDLRIWNCRRFARKSTNAKQRPLYLYAQNNTVLFSVYAEKV